MEPDETNKKSSTWIQEIVSGLKTSFWINILPILAGVGIVFNLYLKDNYVTRDEYEAESKNRVDLTNRIIIIETRNKAREDFELEKFQRNIPNNTNSRK